MQNFPSLFKHLSISEYENMWSVCVYVQVCRPVAEGLS